MRTFRTIHTGRLGTIERAVALVALCFAAASCASSPASNGGASYATPRAGGEALVAALRSNDEASLRAVLGPQADELIASGDDVTDRSEREAFVAAYDRQHTIVADGDDRATLVVGDDWPLPIPLVRDGDAWRFDAEAGREEILARRVGRNELSTILVCRAIVDAQHDYAAIGKDGPREYARKILSDAGARNGLYWETSAGEPPSPLGSLVAEAAAEGYTDVADAAHASQPFHGYLFRVLDAQGASARGGARSYLRDGRMVDGFGVVAWPAAYGNSGVMTFIVCHDGIVYEQDLGDDSARRAARMKSFDPDAGWDVVP